jgi:hypothetical protein
MSTTKDNRIIQPYVFFNGGCEQAVEFYCNALGAEVEAMVRFKDSAEPPVPGMIPPDFENKIHARQLPHRPNDCDGVRRLLRRQGPL